jgi:hypothetical protein
MRLVRSCRRVKKAEGEVRKGKAEGEGSSGRIQEKGSGIKDVARFPGESKNLENSGNKMRGNLVSSIAFP